MVLFSVFNFQNAHDYYRGRDFRLASNSEQFSSNSSLLDAARLNGKICTRISGLIRKNSGSNFPGYISPQFFTPVLNEYKDNWVICPISGALPYSGIAFELLLAKYIKFHVIVESDAVLSHIYQCRFKFVDSIYKKYNNFSEHD